MKTRLGGFARRMFVLVLAGAGVAFSVLAIVRGVVSACGVVLMESVEAGKMIPADTWTIVVPPRTFSSGHLSVEPRKHPWLALRYKFPGQHVCNLELTDLSHRLADGKEHAAALDAAEAEKAAALAEQIGLALCVQSDGQAGDMIDFTAHGRDFVAIELLSPGATVSPGRWAMTVPFRERLTISAHGNVVADHWQAAFNRRPWMTLPYAFGAKNLCEFEAATIVRRIQAHGRERGLNDDERQKMYTLLTQVRHAECVESDGSERFKARTNENW